MTVLDRYARSLVLGELKSPLPYDSLGEVRQKLIETARTFAAIDRIAPAEWGEFGREGKIDSAPFVSPIGNFYMTDPISRNSETMARCTATFILPKQEEATGTDG